MGKISESLIPVEQADEWKHVIGEFIWHMGKLEFLAIDWCDKLGGRELKDVAILQKGLTNRKELVVKHLKSSDVFSDKEKRMVLVDWEKAARFAKFRNTIAHSPVVVYAGMTGIVNARSFLGDGKRWVVSWTPKAIRNTSAHILNLAIRIDQWGKFFSIRT